MQESIETTHTELEERLRFETLLAETSSRFVNVPADQVDGDIEGAQRRICELLDLDRSTLWQVSGTEPVSLVLTHIYQPQGTPPAHEQFTEKLFPWTRQKVLAGETVTVTKMSDLPPEAGRDRETFGLIGTKSDVIVPLSVGGGPPFGLLTFAVMREERVWPETVVKGFRLIAQVFANALARKRADEALRESEARLSLASDVAGAGLWIMELETGHVWVTTKTREMFHFAPDKELNFESFLQVIHPEDRERVKLAVQQALQSGENLRSDYRIVLPDGSLRWIVARGKRYLRSTGEPDRMMGVSLDITERKRAEDEAARARSELLRVDRMMCLNELTASLAHELNQPLAAILSSAQAALRFLQSATPDLNLLRTILQNIVQDDKRAAGTIKGLRSLMKREVRESEPFNMNKVLDDTLNLFRTEAIVRNLTTETDFDSSLPPVLGDKIQLQQVVLNLVMNAADAMSASPHEQEKRKIILRTQATDQGIQVAVRDFGPGIDPAKLVDIWQPFFTTKRTGLGMGLSISRSIIQAHRGRIWAENHPGGGAMFTFEIPSVRNQ
jgi:PAS domain S-box-containing protein